MAEFEEDAPVIAKVTSADGQVFYERPQEEEVQEDAPAAEGGAEEEVEVEEEIEETEELENEETEESEDEGSEEVDEGEESEGEESEEEGEEIVEEDDPFADDEPVEEEDPLEAKGIDFHSVTSGMANDEEELREIFNFLNDPYMKGAFEYFKAEGTLEPYAMAKTYSSDDYWNGISDFDVLAQDLRTQYAAEGLSPEEVELMVEDDLERYDISDEDLTESEIKKRKAKMKLKANQARKKYKEEASKFLSPEPREEQKEKGPTPEQLEQKRLQTENRLKTDLRKQLTNKQLSIQVGDSEIKLNVAPKTLLEMGMSQQKVMQSLFTEDKQLNWVKFAFLSDPDSFMAAIQNNSSAEGAKKFIKKELKNTRSDGKGTTKKAPKPSKKDEYGNPPLSEWRIKNS